MDYPDKLLPDTFESISLSDGRSVEAPKTSPSFTPWMGVSPGETYGGKAILDYRGRPAFAELVILWSFLDAGWDGAWIDTFGRRTLRGFWPLESAVLPSQQAELIAKLGHDGAKAWDVVCWSSQAVLFAEAKRSRKDAIRPSQAAFLENALSSGIPTSSFLLIEWRAG